MIQQSRFRLAVLAALVATTSACACNIPVFRYALERWRPDACELIIFHDGGISETQQSMLDRMVAEHADQIKLERRDVTKEVHHEDWQSMESSFPDITLPYAVVRLKHGSRTAPGWHGSLDALSDAGVFDSPARTELARRLLSSHSVVWIMITSGDQARDKEVRQMLTENFASLSERIELPDGIGLPGSELHSEIPLLVRFSLLEIKRDDPSEQFLVKTLSAFQQQAFDQGEPLVIPVFGRGRALEVIPAEDLSKRLMDDLTVFLSGACSCQVKEQNPGFDLLLSVDWNRELFGEGGRTPPERTSRERGQPVLLTIPPGR